MLDKLRRYTEEMEFCWRIGASIPDSASLAINTLLFHIHNARGDLSCRENEVVNRCRIRLNEQPAIDFHYRTRGGDLFTLYEVMLEQYYWIPSEFAESVKSIVDLGGNIGVATLSLATQFPDASFVCVEANPRNAGVLSKNVAWMGEKARVVHAAISDQDGEAEFKIEGSSWEGSLGRGPGSIRVPCCRLERLFDSMDLDQVDILKVDIEGAERQVFASRGECWKKVHAVVADLHSPYGFEEFATDMQEIGFRAIAPGPEYGNRMPLAIRE